MDIQNVNYICDHLFGHHRRPLEAVRILRYDTALGLIAAKTYLEEHSVGGRQALYNKLCEDFVQNKQDLLDLARNERKRLDLYIEQLEGEIANDRTEAEEL
jgi:hypothetical protein